MDKPQSRICPYLGKSKVNPNQMLCGKLKPPSPIRTLYIKEYCVAEYEQCSIYQGAPGRQSADEKSPLVVVPIAPAQRDTTTKIETPIPASNKAPNVEFLAYETPNVLTEQTEKLGGRLWIVGLVIGILVILVVATLIVTQAL